MSKLLIALSFCVAIFSLSTAAHAGSAQLLLDARTGEGGAQIVAKIEDQEAVRNIDAIIQATDVIEVKVSEN